MQTKIDQGMKELFEQAVDTWGGAMKASMKFQDDVAKWWTQALGQIGSVQDLQSRSCAMIADAIPTAQRNAEEAMRIMDQNYRSALELLKKAMDSGRAESIGQAQQRAQEVLQASLSTLRDNAQAMAQANMRAMQSWADFMRKNANGSSAASAPTAAGSSA
jgi:vacuolar-type H+-ATPase subunit H